MLELAYDAKTGVDMIAVNLTKETALRLKWMSMSSHERYAYVRARAAHSENGVDNSRVPEQLLRRTAIAAPLSCTSS